MVLPTVRPAHRTARPQYPNPLGDHESSDSTSDDEDLTSCSFTSREYAALQWPSLLAANELSPIVDGGGGHSVSPTSEQLNGTPFSSLSAWTGAQVQATGHDPRPITPFPLYSGTSFMSAHGRPAASSSAWAGAEIQLRSSIGQGRTLASPTACGSAHRPGKATPLNTTAIRSSTGQRLGSDLTTGNIQQLRDLSKKAPRVHNVPGTQSPPPQWDTTPQASRDADTSAVPKSAPKVTTLELQCTASPFGENHPACAGERERQASAAHRLSLPTSQVPHTDQDAGRPSPYSANLRARISVPAPPYRGGQPPHPHLPTERAAPLSNAAANATTATAVTAASPVGPHPVKDGPVDGVPLRPVHCPSPRTMQSAQRIVIRPKPAEGNDTSSKSKPGAPERKSSANSAVTRVKNHQPRQRPKPRAHPKPISVAALSETPDSGAADPSVESLAASTSSIRTVSPSHARQHLLAGPQSTNTTANEVAMNPDNMQLDKTVAQRRPVTTNAPPLSTQVSLSPHRSSVHQRLRGRPLFPETPSEGDLMRPSINAAATVSTTGPSTTLQSTTATTDLKSDEEASRLAMEDTQQDTFLSSAFQQPSNAMYPTSAECPPSITSTQLPMSVRPLLAGIAGHSNASGSDTGGDPSSRGPSMSSFSSLCQGNAEGYTDHEAAKLHTRGPPTSLGFRKLSVDASPSAQRRLCHPTITTPQHIKRKSSVGEATGQLPQRTALTTPATATSGGDIKSPDAQFHDLPASKTAKRTASAPAPAASSGDSSKEIPESITAGPNRRQVRRLSKGVAPECQHFFSAEQCIEEKAANDENEANQHPTVLPSVEVNQGGGVGVSAPQRAQSVPPVRLLRAVRAHIGQVPAPDPAVPEVPADREERRHSITGPPFVQNSGISTKNDPTVMVVQRPRQNSSNDSNKNNKGSMLVGTRLPLIRKESMVSPKLQEVVPAGAENLQGNSKKQSGGTSRGEDDGSVTDGVAEMIATTPAPVGASTASSRNQSSLAEKGVGTPKDASVRRAARVPPRKRHVAYNVVSIDHIGQDS